MSFKEVTQLRKSGQLQEAFDMATKDLEQNPNDKWNKRAIVWIYYAYLKKAQESNNINDFLVQIENIKELNLPETESFIFDSVAWSIGKLLFANNQMAPHVLNTIFNQIKDFAFTTPKDSYSFMLKAFKKHAAEWEGFIDFIDWWKLDNFKEEDYNKYTLDNGKQIPSLVESVYIAMSKKLLTEPYNIEKIESFLSKISGVCNSHPQMQYTHYYHAKLLIASDNKKRFLKAFLPFAKKKQRDFWVWELLSEIYNKSSDEYFSCLSKSLSCSAPDKFTINVREKIANVFISKQMLAEAKYEFQSIIKTRQKEGWPLKNNQLAWQSLPWWNNTEANKNNNTVYSKNISLANSLLFANTKEEIAFVDYVNNEKNVFNFIVSKQKYGFSSFKPFDIKLKKGDFLAIRFVEKEDEKSNFYKILSVRKTNELPQQEIYKEIEGKFIISQENSFGSIKNIFVSPQLIQKLKLQNGDMINGFALKKYNTKRKDWGWNLIDILKN